MSPKGINSRLVYFLSFKVFKPLIIGQTELKKAQRILTYQNSRSSGAQIYSEQKLAQWNVWGLKVFTRSHQRHCSSLAKRDRKRVQIDLANHKQSELIGLTKIIRAHWSSFSEQIMSSKGHKGIWLSKHSRRSLGSNNFSGKISTMKCLGLRSIHKNSKKTSKLTVAPELKNAQRDLAAG